MTIDASVDASVVVPSYRGADRLPELLRALDRQTTSRTWEVVVVVDGVVDETPALLARWADRLALQTCVFDRNRGRVPALNRGYAAATGRVLIRCDDDLTPRPDFIERHTAWHDNREDLGVIGLTRDVFAPTPYARAYGRTASERGRVAARRADGSYRWQHWAANNSLTRASWTRVVAFDERFHYGQDFELGWRLNRAGISFVIDDRLETDHRGPAVDVTTRAVRAFTSGSSHRRFDDLHPDATRPPPPSATVKTRLWNAAVRSVAHLEVTTAAAARAGRAIDAVLPRVPPAVGRALVAASVEGAARAGYANPSRASGLDPHRDSGGSS